VYSTSGPAARTERAGALHSRRRSASDGDGPTSSPTWCSLGRRAVSHHPDLRYWLRSQGIRARLESHQVVIRDASEMRSRTRRPGTRVVEELSVGLRRKAADRLQPAQMAPPWRCRGTPAGLVVRRLFSRRRRRCCTNARPGPTSSRSRRTLSTSKPPRRESPPCGHRVRSVPKTCENAWRTAVTPNRRG